MVLILYRKITTTKAFRKKKENGTGRKTNKLAFKTVKNTPLK